MLNLTFSPVNRLLVKLAPALKLAVQAFYRWCQKRNAAPALIAQRRTERQSGALLKLHRSARRYVSKRPPDATLTEKIKSIAAERPRFGYLRIHAMLKGQGVHANHKRVYGI